jgi:hypothetical protein
MTARTATVRIYVAFASLVADVLILTAALVRLVAVAAVWLIRRIGPRTHSAAPERHVRGLPSNVRLQDVKPVLSLVRAKEPVGQPVPLCGAQRLTTALLGLGFKAPAVRAFVASVGPRVERDRIEDLIKEGLRALHVSAA